MANLPAINIAAKTVKAEHPDVTFAIMDPLVIGREVSQRIREAQGTAQHGGEFEMSHMLYRHPELVKEDRAVRHHAEVMESRLVFRDHLRGGDRVALVAGAEEQDTQAPLGHIGDPTVGTREKGEALYGAIVANGVEFIRDLRRGRKSA